MSDELNKNLVPFTSLQAVDDITFRQIHERLGIPARYDRWLEHFLKRLEDRGLKLGSHYWQVRFPVSGNPNEQIDYYTTRDTALVVAGMEKSPRQIEFINALLESATQPKYPTLPPQLTKLIQVVESLPMVMATVEVAADECYESRQDLRVLQDWLEPYLEDMTASLRSLAARSSRGVRRIPAPLKGREKLEPIDNSPYQRRIGRD